MFSTVSLENLRQLWWNMAVSWINLLQSDVSETWNAHRVRTTLALLDTETPEFIPPQLWSPNSPDLNPVDNSVWKILQEGVQNMHHWSAAIDDATDGWLPQWRCDPACSTPFLVAVSVCLDQWCVFFTSSVAIFPTLCNQLNYLMSNINISLTLVLQGYFTQLSWFSGCRSSICIINCVCTQLITFY